MALFATPVKLQYGVVLLDWTTMEALCHDQQEYCHSLLVECVSARSVIAIPASYRPSHHFLIHLSFFISINS